MSSETDNHANLSASAGNPAPAPLEYRGSVVAPAAPLVMPMRAQAVAIVGIVIALLSMLLAVIQICVFGSAIWDAAQPAVWQPGQYPLSGQQVPLGSPSGPRLGITGLGILVAAYVLVIICDVILFKASRKILAQSEDALKYAGQYAIVELVCTLIVRSILFLWAEEIVDDFYHAGGPSYLASVHDTPYVFRTGVALGLVLCFAWVVAWVAVVNSRAVRTYWSSIHPTPEQYSKLVVRQSYPD